MDLYKRIWKANFPRLAYQIIPSVFISNNISKKNFVRIEKQSNDWFE